MMKTFLTQKILNINSSGYETYNNTKCAIGEFYIETSNLTIKIWLDANKGTCLKTINTGIDSSGKPYEHIEEYIATYGVVTNQDVMKPSLTGYTELKQQLKYFNKKCKLYISKRNSYN